MKNLFAEVKEVISDLFFTLALFNIHLLAILLLFFSLGKRLSEESCDIFVVVSPYDLAIGDRYFYFCMTSIWNQLLYLLDQPALQFGKFVTWLIGSLTNLSLEQSSWLFAIVILISTTLQWLVIGHIIDSFRRKRLLRKRAFCVSQHPTNQWT